MKISYKSVLFLFSNLFFSLMSYGQNQFITGKVIDEAGNPVAYASITFKGTGKGGTWTSENGDYKTYLPKGVDTIICSHINYIKKEEKIEGSTILNFTLNKQIPHQSGISIIGTHKYTVEELNNLKLKNDLVEEPNKVFSKIEINALFPGGESAVQKYLVQSIVYPDSANISNVRGTVKVGFIIGKDGLAKNATLLKGINKYTDKAVLDAVIRMPKWIPAVQNGRNVEQYKEVSVAFDIKGEK
jgi:TonB family protein